MADETNGAGPSARTRPEAHTTMNFTAGQMAPLETRKALRKQRAAENAALYGDFNNADYLKSVAAAETSGERGPAAQARRQALGTDTGSAAPEGDEAPEDEPDGTEGKVDASTVAGSGWGAGAAGVTAEAPTPAKGRAKAANK